jgi:excisionase family DNA binding protein
MPEQIAVSVEEAGKLAGVGRTTIFKELRDGRLKGRKIGRRTVVPIDELNAWLTSLPTSRSIPEETNEVQILSREAPDGRAR